MPSAVRSACRTRSAPAPACVRFKARARVVWCHHANGAADDKGGVSFLDRDERLPCAWSSRFAASRSTERRGCPMKAACSAPGRPWPNRSASMLRSFPISTGGTEPIPAPRPPRPVFARCGSGGGPALPFQAVRGDARASRDEGVELKVVYGNPNVEQAAKNDLVDLPARFGLKVTNFWLTRRMLYQPVLAQLLGPTSRSFRMPPPTCRTTCCSCAAGGSCRASASSSTTRSSGCSTTR